MNYIKEINAFYVKLETVPLSGSAISLWYALMHVNNRTRWMKEFSVAASVLSLKAGLPLSTFKRARLELRDKGFIIYTPRGQQAPMYEMVSLMHVNNDEFSEVHDEPEIEVHTESINSASKQQEQVKCDEIEGQSMLDLMQEILYEGETAESDQKRLEFRTYEFFVDHFGKPAKCVADELYRWGERIGDTLVYEALVRGVESGHLSWNYVQGILRNWQQDRLFTIEDVLDSEERFRRKRGYRYGQNRGVQREEIVPDWFKERSG